MTRPLKTPVILLAAAVFVLGVAVSPAAAKKAAKKPACWKVLINDWFDGTIDGKYGLGCYREALQHLKGVTDALAYTDAYDQINRAYQQRRAELAGVDYREGDSERTDNSPSGGSGPPTGREQHRVNAPTVPGSTLPGRPKRGPAPDLISNLGPDDATSIPIPLIVLAGIAVLLMAAGAASLIARRARVRRVTAPVQPAPPAGGQ